ncbi:MAG: acetylxylan esterase [Acidobacteria bacterium]|nr:acetylxylan esterase [Acidobacteriota bacterium]MBI3471493.1 acetylxylan esterase [Candidatus Solibacter usitatus]
MTRRQLAALAAAGALAGRKTARAASKYTGALDGFESKVDGAAFDPLIYSRKLYEKAPLRLTFRATSRKQAEAWQNKLRAKLTELLGMPPRSRAPLNPITLETREFPGYRREKLVFSSEPGLHVLAYLLTPSKGQAPHATVICVPGHGRGVDDIVGIDAEGRDRTGKEGYQHDFALQVVEQGLAAAAIEPIAFGCRRDPAARKGALGRSSCQPIAGSALLLGQTMIGWRVRDVMRTIDWIETRKELDATRVGCMGISGGGTCTLFSSAMEPRIRAAMVSGYLCTFRDSIFSLSHCMDNYVPGILNWAEMYDIAGLIAPRPLFAESGEKDDIFPIDAFRASFARVRKVYEVLGAADRIEQETFNAAHSFHGVKGLAFLKQRLTAPA